MNFVGSSVLTFVTKIAETVLNLALTVIIARALGPTGRGTYALFITTSMFLLLFSKLGLGQGCVYYIGSAKYPKQELAGTAILAGLCTGTLSALAVVLYAVLLDKSLLGADAQRWAVWLLVAMTPADVLNLFARLIFLSSEKILHYNLVSLLRFGLSIALVLGLLLLQVEITIEHVLVAYSAGPVLVAIVSLIVLRRMDLLRFTFKASLFRLLLSYGIRTNVGNISKNLLMRMDVFVVESLLGTAAVGLYATAAGLVEKLFYIPRSMSPILFQRVSTQEARKSAAFTASVARKTMVPLVLASLALLALAGPIVRLLYPGFEASIPALYVLLPGVVLFSLFEILSSSILGRGQATAYMVTNLISAAANIALAYTLVPIWGIVGAAAASTIAYSLVSIIALVYFSRTSQISIRDTVIPTGQDWREVSKALKRLVRKETIVESE